MASVEVALHGGHGVAHQAERHVAIGRRLVLDEHVNVAVAGGGFQAVIEERGPACTLLVCVDDATSRLMQLHFVRSESTFTYFEATRGYLEQHGKPLAL